MSKVPRSLRFQRAFSRFSFIFLVPLIRFCLKFIGRFRIENLDEIRNLYKALKADSSPLIICSNHLTYLDSTILIYALGSDFWYFFNYSYFPWNLPAIEYSKNPVFKAICYPNKCIFINRKGSGKYHSQILSVCKDLLEAGEVITIFPEGQRGRTELFDDRRLAQGVGKIISELKECRVLCIYLRSREQKAFSKFPPFKSSFKLFHQVIKFNNETSPNWDRAEITKEIGKTIKKLEQDYMAFSPDSLPKKTLGDSVTGL